MADTFVFPWRRNTCQNILNAKRLQCCNLPFITSNMSLPLHFLRPSTLRVVKTASTAPRGYFHRNTLPPVSSSFSHLQCQSRSYTSDAKIPPKQPIGPNQDVLP